MGRAPGRALGPGRRVSLRPLQAPYTEPPPGVSPQRDPCYSQSLERGLGVLACFTPARKVLGVAEIADRLGISRSTTHRYVITLVELGLLARTAGRKYRLALGVTRLGLATMSGMGLRAHAGPYLRELGQRTGFAVGMGVLDGSEVLLVEWLAGVRLGQPQVERGLAVGAMLPAYCTALGKLLLADHPTEARRVLLGGLVLSAWAPKTITSKRALRSELAGVRKTGIGVEDEEHAPGVVGIAAPVRASGGETVAALGMVAAARTIALEELVGALGPHLVATADRVSARLGFRRPDELIHGPSGVGNPTSPTRIQHTDLFI